MSSLQNVLKSTFGVIFMLLSMSVVAEPTLTVDESSACEGYPVVLKASGFSINPSNNKVPEAANLLKSTDGGSTWTAVMSAYDPSGVFTFVDDMGSKSVIYKVQAQLTNEATETVSVALSTNCTAACHTTSSGDYYLGTDFDPEYGYGPEDINWSTVPPTYLSSHFKDNSIDFKANTGCGGQDIKNWTYSDGVAPSVDRNNIYADTDKDGLPDFWEKDNGLDMYDSSDATNIDPNTGLTYLAAYRQKYDFDGDGLPNGWEEKNRLDPRDPEDANLIADPILGLTYLEKFKKEVSGSNYYYVFSACSQPFELTFNGSAYRNKYYRFTLKMYIDLTGCSSSDRQQLGNAMMNFRTDYGNDSYNAVDVEIYNDATDILLDKKAFEIKGQLSQDIIGDIFKNNPSVNKFRMDVTMYGQFTGNQGKFGVIPEFQQWRNCMKVAVDYISADVENVCMEHGAVCLGQSTVINAAGFPRNSVYKWEEDILGNGNWTIVNIGGFDMVGKEYQKINLPVNFIGTRKFRVSGSGSILGQTQTTSVEFNVTGKNCEPLQPASIEGPANPFCIPNSKEQGKFSVSPMDANPSVTYTWQFTTPNGETFGSDRLHFTGGDLETSDARGGSVFLLLDGNAEEGDYTVTVQAVKTVQYSDGTSHNEVTGDPVSKTFTVYKTPRMRIIKEGTDPLQQDAVEICPTDDQQKFIAVADPVEGFTSQYMDRYVYTWLSGATGEKEIADIVIDGDVCSGVTARHSTSLNVQIAEVGCPLMLEQTWRYGRHVDPTMDCNTAKNKTVTLAKTESKTSVSLLPLPSYTAGCETNPRLSVTLDFTPSDGEKITKTIELREKDLATTDFNVELPAGTGTISYSVIDGCGSTANCSITITIIDNTAPDIDCSEIKPYTTHLTNQAGCDAVPDYYTVELPKLVIPELEDQNGADGIVKGVFEGRVTNPVVTPSATSAFKAYLKDTAVVKLNDPFDVGETYILWSFSDKSGNTSYCLQSVTVIDDRKPIVTCPSSELGDLETNEGECGLSLRYLMTQMEQKGIEKPSAVDVCSGNGVTIVPVMYYFKTNTRDEVVIPESGLSEIPEKDWDKIIFETSTPANPVVYKLIWRFYKLGDHTSSVFDDCVQTFEVFDKEAPVFDCTQLLSVRVTANTYKPLNQSIKYLSYATKNDVTITSGVGPGAQTEKYVGTLASYFSNGTIRMIEGSEVNDNCSDKIAVSVELFGPDETGTLTTSTVNSLKDLEDHKYYVGLTTITYTFTDEQGNASSCTQNIIVTAGTTPIPDCPSTSDTTLFVDDKCEVTFVLKKSDVPTAKIPVNQEGCYFELHYAAVKGLHMGQLNGPSATGDLCEDAKVVINNLDKLNAKPSATVGGGPTFPGFPPAPAETHDFDMAYFCQQFTTNWSNFRTSAFNTWRTWLKPGFETAAGANGRVLEESNSLTTDSLYLGYPFEVELLDSDNNSIVKVENPYSEADKADARVIVPRPFDGNDGIYSQAAKGCRKAAYVCQQIDVKVANNFSDELFSQKLKKGDYRLVWRFQNQKGGTQLDSCVIDIVVKDEIAPVVSCGDWSKTGTFPADENCVVPVDEVSWFKKPTPADLEATDNCSAQADLTISWERRYKEWIETGDVALTNPFQMGTTQIYWYVSDASGNKAQCLQEITVVDKTGPAFDCSSLNPIEASTKDSCYADISDVLKAGLVPLSVEDDKCSPTGGRIYASYFRSDSTAANPVTVFGDNYPVGTTTITWIFKDGATPANETICHQDVVVTDTTAPVFVDCSNLEDVIIDLDPTECVASKEKVRTALGSHTAKDNCEGNIEGVPFVMQADKSLVPLLEEFNRDTTYHIVWVFEDSKNNKQECDQFLIINDVTPPDPSDKCPTDPFVDVDATVTCSVNFSDLNLKSAEDMAIIDLCDGKIVPTIVAKITQNDGSIITYIADEALAATYPVGTHHVLYVYEDKAGNKDTCDITVNVIDRIKPVMEDCDVRVDVSLTVSDSICSVDPADVKALIVEPKAYDECDDLSANIGITYLKPVVKRYEIDSTVVRNAEGVFVGYKYDTTLVADGVTKMWDEERFPKGVTRLTWIFTDKTGNQDSCSKNVIVYDHTPPYFDCANIDPDTLRPEAPAGQCEYEFKLLKEEILNGLNYKAYDACAEDSIPGVLTLNGLMELPDEYTMKVGVLYKLLWMFKDEDGNATTCPQWVLPSHLNPLNVVCSDYPDTIPLIAVKGTCDASQEAVDTSIVVPTVMDACELGIVTAVPYFFTDSDTLLIDLSSQKFSTGDTTIHWRFVSPWNLHDTAWCEQVVHVAGNKDFEFDCDTLTPEVKDTIDTCEPSESVLAKIKTPFAPDPCAEVSSPDYLRPGLGTRSDSTSSDPKSVYTDPYPLGITTIKWIFTDFTGSVKDSCEQEVNIKTSLDIVMNCDSLNHDTLRAAYEVPDGVCSVEAEKILDPDTLVPPAAKHPCLPDAVIRVYPRRAGGKSWTDNYIVGVNEIEWVFIDDTHTTLNDSVVCIQPLQLGDSDASLFKCDTIKDIRKELDPADCSIDPFDLDFTKDVPTAYDACGVYAGQEIVPTWYRTSGKGMTAPFEVGHDTIVWTFHYESLDYDVVCKQDIHILDDKKPLFDCSSLPDTTMKSVEGECYLEQASILSMLEELSEKNLAYDACDSTPIKGLYDKSIVPAKLNVGDTIIVHWVFQDTVRSLQKKECDQMITVIGDMAPIIKCDTLSHDTINIAGCDTTLSEQTIVAPIAKDACTGTDVIGKGFRLDGGDLYGLYPVGTTTIRWIFKSDYSTATDSCDQQLTILTEKDIDFDCESLKAFEDTVFNVVEGECSVVVTLPAQTGLHPCPEQSGVTSIVGVPSSNGKNFAMNADSTWSLELPTGVWEIKWTFTDTSNTMVNPIKICSHNVKVGDVNEMPVDCKNYPDTVVGLKPGDCEISWADINFEAPAVIDLCSKDTIVPTLTRWSGKEITESFVVGIDTVFWSYSFAGQDITCKQAINVRDSIQPDFDCNNLKPLELTAPLGECTLSPEALVDSLGQWFAVDVCSGDSIPGVATVDNVAVENVTLHVGDTVNVHWVFIDTLINALPKECDQLITVIGQNEPIFKCESLSDTTLYLGIDECTFPGTKFNINPQTAIDTCTGTPVPGVPSRQDGLPMTANFEKGTTVVVWTFTSDFSIVSKTCTQNVIVVDENAPIADCTDLMDTIHVRITADSQYDDRVTYQEVTLAEGFKIPTMVDLCDGLLTAVGSRVDGEAFDGTYPLGATDIIWTYTDSSMNTSNVSTCPQVILVEDYLIDTLKCPTNWNNKTIACLDTFPIYATFEEFVAAGGSFTNPSKMKPESFYVTEDFDGKQYCDEKYYRTYHVLDVRNNDITCTDTVFVKDTIAPTFQQNITGDAVLTCIDDVPAMIDVTAIDNCDPEPKVTTSDTNTRGTDPSKCDYYNYTITRTYTAIDRCDQKTEISRTIFITDTIGPKFEKPSTWQDTVLAQNLKSCSFGIPDLTIDMEKWVKDDCTDNTGITITQTPAPGSIVSTTTTVWIKMTDLCNNSDSIAKFVRVQDPKMIVSLAAFEIDTCVTDDKPFLLSSQRARFADGHVEIVRANGKISKISSQFCYDYYAGTGADALTDENLLFTDNPVTHKNVLDSYQSQGGVDNMRTILTALNRHSQSGDYTYIAMDTITGCSDTATAYVKINERPRISLESGWESVCELTVLDSTTFDSYLDCVNGMGRAVKDQGWVLGDSVWSIAFDTVRAENDKMSMVYYATNDCGTTTSLNTLPEFCGAAPQTKEDSLYYVGGNEAMYNLLKKDQYVVSDSILLDVHKRYDPANIVLTTDPNDPPRIWLGEVVELSVRTDYQYDVLKWYRVVGDFDRNRVNGIEQEEFQFAYDSLMLDEEDYLLAVDGYGQKPIFVDSPEDTTKYYVTLSDGVCPSVASELVQVNVILKLPTAFTPYTIDGMNDIFMERHSIVIFDRYGQKVFEGDNGWNGTSKGRMVDPGVYFYAVVMTDGSTRKGSIEVVFLND